MDGQSPQGSRERVDLLPGKVPIPLLSQPKIGKYKTLTIFREYLGFEFVLVWLIFLFIRKKITFIYVSTSKTTNHNRN